MGEDDITRLFEKLDHVSQDVAALSAKQEMNTETLGRIEATATKIDRDGCSKFPMHVDHENRLRSLEHGGDRGKTSRDKGAGKGRIVNWTPTLNVGPVHLTGLAAIVGVGVLTVWLWHGATRRAESATERSEALRESVVSLNGAVSNVVVQVQRLQGGGKP